MVGWAAGCVVCQVVQSGRSLAEWLRRNLPVLTWHHCRTRKPASGVWSGQSSGVCIALASLAELAVRCKGSKAASWRPRVVCWLQPTASRLQPTLPEGVSSCSGLHGMCRACRQTITKLQQANVATRKEIDWQAQLDALTDARRLLAHHLDVSWPVLQQVSCFAPCHYRCFDAEGHKPPMLGLHATRGGMLWQVSAPMLDPLQPNAYFVPCSQSKLRIVFVAGDEAICS